MSVNYGDGVPDSALIMLAGLILKRARLTLPNNTREQAITIIKGIKPSPSKKMVMTTKPVPLPPPTSMPRRYESQYADGRHDKLFDSCVAYVDELATLGD